MLKKIAFSAMAVVLVWALGGSPLDARTCAGPEYSKERHRSFATGAPIFQVAAHTVGILKLAVANNGTFGVNGTTYRPDTPVEDCFTGELIPFSCEYPKGNDVDYAYSGAFWIGAVVGRDTLVSCGMDGWHWGHRELFPDEEPFGRMQRRSIIDPESPEFVGAISEQDFISVYTDTFTEGLENDYFGRPHVPLPIEVNCTTYAWSYPYAEDIILFAYTIKNLGTQPLQDVYLGVYVAVSYTHLTLPTN